MKEKLNVSRNQIIGISTIIVMLISLSIFILGRSYALVSGDRVDENSELTYYLTVNYDGVDVTGKESNDTTTAEVRSDIIIVEDKIPDGLIFQGFVGTPGQQIDAVKRSDTSQGCSGYVIDGYEGLFYDDTTRTVSFEVKGLQAGCQLTVGVITKTPSLNGKDRIDFYNTAYSREDRLTTSSNTFHSYIGEEPTTKYKVIYNYNGNVPEEAPSLPTEKEYAENSEVAIETIPEIDGYNFSGFWCNTTVNDNKFIITENVYCTGSFTKTEVVKYKVSYKIEGDTPKGYVLPETEEYKDGALVKIDDTVVKNSLTEGYKFLGWEDSSNTITISNDNDFVMPNKNIELVGKFERIEYTLEYQIEGDIPTGVILPTISNHYPTEEVTVENKFNISGYDFNGWYSNDVEISNNKLIMPEKNIVLYGSFSEQAGLFELKITMEVENKKDKYEVGDVIKYNIEVENTAGFEIKDVYITQSIGKFAEDDSYNIEADSFVKIDSIADNKNVIIKSEYIVDESSDEVIVNEAELLGAIADNNYNLDTSKVYKARVEAEKKTSIIDNIFNNPSTGQRVVTVIVIMLILVSVATFIVLKGKKEKS